MPQLPNFKNEQVRQPLVRIKRKLKKLQNLFAYVKPHAPKSKNKINLVTDNTKKQFSLGTIEREKERQNQKFCYRVYSIIKQIANPAKFGIRAIEGRCYLDYSRKEKTKNS